MGLGICSYNVEWFDGLFNQENRMLSGGKHEKRLDAIARVLKAVDCDLVGILEAPNSSSSSGKDTEKCLETFAEHYGLRTSRVLMGFPSQGQQEIALLYDPSKVQVSHSPGGSGKKHPPFTERLEIDTDDDSIKEIYQFHRPPLEVEVMDRESQKSFKMLVAHTKSKGIFSSSDMVHWDRQNFRNRRKLLAQCSWIRQRVDQWLDQGERVLVMGDINDGPGMDSYEQQFGKSAVEVIMGDLHEPHRILVSHIGKPKWGPFGWVPSSTSFKDRFTEKYVNVLIDHILVSQDLKVQEGSHRVWNPFQDDQLESMKEDLLGASDHFPVSIELDLGE